MNNAGLYIRLSINDSENESINNQISILKEYCKIHKINIFDIYIDNGYTGTNYNRPSFNKLLNDIYEKRFNIVITKDFSRLGRDYIETGNYIEKIFPKLNVRYISILDNYDSLNDYSDFMPFKFIINEFYSKDLSKKIRSSLYNKKKQGLYLGSKAPYGYKKINKYYLEIDKETCKVVEYIFLSFINGQNSNKIARYLSNLNILSPSNNTIWNTKTIRDILINQVYIGNLVQGKRKRINYKIRKEKKVVKEEYIIVKNTHPAIIDKNIFFKAQHLINKSKNKNYNYILKGKLKCKECGSNLSILKCKNRKYPYISCPKYRNYKKCKPHTMNYNKLEEFINKFYDYNEINYLLIDNNNNIEIIKKHISVFL